MSVCEYVCAVHAESVEPEAIMASILAYTWPSKLKCWIITIFATHQELVRMYVCYRPELKMGKGLLRNFILAKGGGVE